MLAQVPKKSTRREKKEAKTSETDLTKQERKGKD
jgi:hypothetical protein